MASATPAQTRRRTWSPDSAIARPTWEDPGATGVSTDSGTLPPKTRTDVKVSDPSAPTYYYSEVTFVFCLLECTCNIKGIVSNDGCNQETGDCTCKRFVVGRDCDQCMPQHYGLALEDRNGCKPCDCDIGGATDNNCDVVTGQCKCRPNVGGRRCDQVEDGFYTGPLDYLLFEGELAFGSQNPVC